MNALKAIWRGWKRLGLEIGNFVSSVILTLFYFTAFALFAIPFRIFGRSPLTVQGPRSNWINKRKTPTVLPDFQEEF